MFKTKKCSYQTPPLNSFKKIFFSLLVGTIFSGNVFSQCNPVDLGFDMVETDLIINYNFTSSVTGVDYIQPLELNLPLCSESAEEGAGCTQVAISPLNYGALGLGYSGGTLQVFWRDIWENQVNGAGDFILDDTETIIKP